MVRNGLPKRYSFGGGTGDWPDPNDDAGAADNPPDPNDDEAAEESDAPAFDDGGPAEPDDDNDTDVLQGAPGADVTEEDTSFPDQSTPSQSPQWSNEGAPDESGEAPSEPQEGGTTSTGLPRRERKIMAKADAYQPQGGVQGSTDFGLNGESELDRLARHADKMDPQQAQAIVAGGKGNNDTERFMHAWANTPQEQQKALMQYGMDVADKAFGLGRVAADNGDWDQAAKYFNAGHAHIIDGYHTQFTPTDGKMIVNATAMGADPNDPNATSTYAIPFDQFKDWAHDPKHFASHSLMQTPGGFKDGLAAAQQIPGGNTYGGTPDKTPAQISADVYGNPSDTFDKNDPGNVNAPAKPPDYMKEFGDSPDFIKRMQERGPGGGPANLNPSMIRQEDLGSQGRETLKRYGNEAVTEGGRPISQLSPQRQQAAPPTGMQPSMIAQGQPQQTQQTQQTQQPPQIPQGPGGAGQPLGSGPQQPQQPQPQQPQQTRPMQPVGEPHLAGASEQDWRNQPTHNQPTQPQQLDPKALDENGVPNGQDEVPNPAAGRINSAWKNPLGKWRYSYSLDNGERMHRINKPGVDKTMKVGSGKNQRIVTIPGDHSGDLAEGWGGGGGGRGGGRGSNARTPQEQMNINEQRGEQNAGSTPGSRHWQADEAGNWSRHYKTPDQEAEEAKAAGGGGGSGFSILHPSTWFSHGEPNQHGHGVGGQVRDTTTGLIYDVMPDGTYQLHRQ